jgi:small GTP-binding protein
MNNTKKVVLMGHFGVGKSSLIRRFVENVFSDDYKVTIGVHILKKTIKVNGQDLTLVLWDIEGKDDINEVRKSHLLGTSGFIYVFDPTRKSTFENINADHNYIKSNFSKASLLTVANKSDLIEENDFIKENTFQIDYFVSAKTNFNVELVFNKLGINILNGK